MLFWVGKKYDPGEEWKLKAEKLHKITLGAGCIDANTVCYGGNLRMKSRGKYPQVSEHI